MAEFEPPPPAPPKPHFEPDPPRRDVPYTPPERRFERAPQADPTNWIPRIAAVGVLVVLMLGYVVTAHRGERPMGFPYSMIALLLLAFVQWMPVERTRSGKLLIAMLSLGGSLLWLAASVIRI